MSQHKELLEQTDEFKRNLYDFGSLIQTTAKQINSFNRLALKQASFFMAAHSIFEVETMNASEAEEETENTDQYGEKEQI